MTPLRSSIFRPALLALALALPAFATVSAQSNPLPGSTVHSDSAAMAKARADSIRYPYTAADVHFMSAMIGHHAQAIEMSRLAMTRDASPEVRRLAERIINAQVDEIATMQQWLRDRRQRVPEAKAGPMKMTMNGMEHDMLMPGMLTNEEMAALERETGLQFDRRFLSAMMQHHRGAVSMVKDLFGSYGAAQDEVVFKFASDVGVDQATEIARMEKMLAALIFGIPAR